MTTLSAAHKVIKNGFIATLRRARRYHQCQVCKGLIVEGEAYYSLVRGGGGLGWIKFPDRCHIDCLEKYFEEHDEGH